jgi:glycine/D-amino acid oxidase-like deaminating enzyme
MKEGCNFDCNYIWGGLAAAIKKLGCEICEETPVVEKEGIVVKTDTGHTVAGVAVMLAKNSPIHKSIAICS